MSLTPIKCLFMSKYYVVLSIILLLAILIWLAELCEASFFLGPVRVFQIPYNFLNSNVSAVCGSIFKTSGYKQ